MILCLFFGLTGYHFTECCVSTLNLSGLVSDCRSAHIYQYDPCQTGFNFFFKKWDVFGKWIIHFFPWMLFMVVLGFFDRDQGYQTLFIEDSGGYVEDC